jgi:hypothetical protein
MYPRFQFVPSARRVSGLVCCSLLLLLVGASLVWPIAARAQSSPFGAVGRVEGRDISCETGDPANGGSSAVGPSLEVSNGTVVTVHSGQALLTLFAGGQVFVCGPAKFTVLLSGAAITLALNFGRMRVELPANTALRIFTPTIIGTPLDISGGSRNVTVGLSLDDSLCVLASSGAIQLEHQFTGEKLIVPQAGEFFLNAGKLLPVAGTPGTCQCTAATPNPPAPTHPQYAVIVPPPATRKTDRVPAPAPAPVADAPSPVTPPATAPVIVTVAPPPATTTPAPAHAPVVAAPTPAPTPTPAPVYAVTVTPPVATAPAPVPPPMAVESAPEPETKPNIEISVLAKANETHPVAPPAKTVVPASPPSTSPVYTAVLPPFTYVAGLPPRPPDLSVDMVVLIREAKVSPEWEFSGHVAAPEFAQAMQHALGEKPAEKQAHSSSDDQPAAKPAKKKGGFWASLKRAFGGGGSEQD